MPRVAIFTMALFAFVLGYAGNQLYRHFHLPPPTTSESVAPIQIIINPEARVSVSLTGNWPPPEPCGKPLVVPIQVINQGFVTATLEARIVDDVDRKIKVD